VQNLCNAHRNLGVISGLQVIAASPRQRSTRQRARKHSFEMVFASDRSASSTF
jgi:hypothetical protein